MASRDATTTLALFLQGLAAGYLVVPENGPALFFGNAVEGRAFVYRPQPQPQLEVLFGDGFGPAVIVAES